MPRKGHRSTGITLTEAQRGLLKEARRLLGLTGEVLGERVGVTQAAVVRYEQGLSRPSKEVLVKWAGELGYEVLESGVEIRPKAARLPKASRKKK